MKKKRLTQLFPSIFETIDLMKDEIVPDELYYLMISLSPCPPLLSLAFKSCMPPWAGQQIT